jgi:hypothetical protein
MLPTSVVIVDVKTDGENHLIVLPRFKEFAGSIVAVAKFSESRTSTYWIDVAVGLIFQRVAKTDETNATLLLAAP